MNTAQQIELETTPTKKSSTSIHETKSNSTSILWNDYFMFLALLSAKRSKDPVTQVGACIVDNENRIVSIGYNGLPRNCHDDKFPWGKSEDTIDDKKLYIVHAEANAILNKNSAMISGMRLFTTLFPCNECTKLIIQSGIGTIYYLSDKYEHKAKYRASKRMFDATRVQCIRLEPKLFRLTLDFIKIIQSDPSSPFKKLELESPQRTLVDYNDVKTELMLSSSSSLSLPLSSVNDKRLDYLQWNDYFMAIALLSAKRSKDPEIQVGACIIDNENRVVAIGYNGLPRHCSDKEFPLEKSDNKIDDKKLYIVHAEANAILNTNSTSVKDMRLFTTLFPCNECTKLIIQSGIGQIIYLSDVYEKKTEYEASKRMLDAARIVYDRYLPVRKIIELDFNEIIKEDPSTPMKIRKLNL